jgi:hypothetical protein
MFGLIFGRSTKKREKKSPKAPNGAGKPVKDPDETAPVAPGVTETTTPPPKRGPSRPPGSKNRVISYAERLDRERWRYLCALRKDNPERYRRILERGMGTAEAAGDMSLATLAEAMRILKELGTPRNVLTSERFEDRNASKPGGALQFGHLIDAFTPRLPAAPATPASPGSNVTRPTRVSSLNDCPL